MFEQIRIMKIQNTVQEKSILELSQDFK